MEKKIILLGAGKNLHSVLEILKKLRGFDLIEVWDNDRKKTGMKVYYLGEVYHVQLPHKISSECLIYITSAIHEDEMRKKLVEEFQIDNRQIQYWKQCFNGIKNKIIEHYKGSNDYQIHRIIKFIDSHDLDVFNYPEYNKCIYDSKKFEICFDKTIGLFFSYWRGKKIYLKRGMNHSMAQNYLKSIYAEQESWSPHSYDQWGMEPKINDVIIDAGAAEGFFALERIDTAKKIIIIENDTGWLEALKYTFAPYGNKICIIPKRLSNIDDEENITVDSIDKKEKVSFIKMDVEGAEKKAMTGAEKFLSDKRNLRILACVYHNSEDAYELSKKLLDAHFSVRFSDGYMFFPYGENILPELRHGLIIAVKRYRWGINK